MFRTPRLAVLAAVSVLLLAAPPAHATEECVEVGQVRHCLS